MCPNSKLAIFQADSQPSSYRILAAAIISSTTMAMTKDKTHARTKSCLQRGWTDTSQPPLQLYSLTVQFHQLQDQLPTWMPNKALIVWHGDANFSQRLCFVATLCSSVWHCSSPVLTGCVTTLRRQPFPSFSHYRAPASPMTCFPVVSGFPLTFGQRARPLPNFSKWKNISRMYVIFKSQVHFWWRSWFPLQRPFLKLSPDYSLTPLYPPPFPPQSSAVCGEDSPCSLCLHQR